MSCIRWLKCDCVMKDKTFIFLFHPTFFFLIFGVVVLILSEVGAQSKDLPFTNGVTAYREKDWQHAFEFFETAIKTTHSRQGFAWYNLGLSAFELGKTGYAIGSWRKALSLDPDLTIAEEAIEIALKKAPGPFGADDSFHTPYSKYLSWTFWRLEFWVYSIVLVACFILRTFLKTKFIQQQANKENRVVESNLGPLWGSTVVLVILCTGLFFKILDLNIERATVIVPSIALRTLPDESATPLLTIFEGWESQVLRSKNGWTHIQLSDSMNGWVPDNTVMPTSGWKLW